MYPKSESQKLLDELRWAAWPSAWQWAQIAFIAIQTCGLFYLIFS